MPPKKAEEKKKQKVVEDRTFGLKNKNKSSKVQKYIQQVQQQVQQQGKRKSGPAEPSRKEKKEAEAARQAELDKLFKPVVDKKQVIQPGVDPKSVLCEWFVKGACKKGSKCKFSHDMDVARKSAKIDVYTDRRDLQEPALTSADGDYDAAALQAAIDKKSNRTETDIICKYFLEAIEKRLYGWFWECPNGATCKYKHALPPGYVLKSQKKEEVEDDEPQLSLEETLDLERAKIISGTPVTQQSFIEWKRRKEERKKKEAEEQKVARDKELKQGKTQMSGRELFEYQPDLFVDDEEGLINDEMVRDSTEGMYDISNLGKLNLNGPAEAEAATAADEAVDESLFAGADDVEVD